ncbi:MAG: PrsW family glutamic-type intramembrane protease [Rhodospirillales bacterium]|nr:PrsW family glutamic-type intramembrane protease [Rhodospirillales bacterium]
MFLLIPLVAVVPGLLLLVYFNARQEYHLSAELVWNAVLLGAAVSVLAVALELPADHAIEVIEDPYYHAVARAFFGTSLPEELVKFAVVYWIALRHEDYGRPVDALVLSVAVALGFATFENLLYLIQSDDWSRTATARAMTAVPSHVINGMLMGYFLGRAHLKPELASLFRCLALAVPILNHGFYDLPLFLIDALHREVGPEAAGLSLPFIAAFAGVIGLGSLIALVCWADLLRRDARDAAARDLPFAIARLPETLRRWEGRLWLLVGGGLALFRLFTGLIGFVFPVSGAPRWAALYPQYFLLASSILPFSFGAAMLVHGLAQLRQARRAPA